MSSPYAEISPVDFFRRRPMLVMPSIEAEGLYHLVYEWLYLAVQERMAGSEIEVELLPDRGCRLSDQGDGHQYFQAGGRFLVDELNGSSWHYPHVTTLINVLSSRCLLKVVREGLLWHQEFQQGRPFKPIEVVPSKEPCGTEISFWPDREIFGETVQFPIDTLAGRMRDTAFLNPGLKLRLIAHGAEPRRQEIYLSTSGLDDFVSFLNITRKPVHPQVVHIEGQDQDRKFAIALQWTEAPDDCLHAFANNHRNSRGGSHLTGLENGLTQVLKQYARFFGAIENEDISAEDCRAGLTAVVAVELPWPGFTSAARTWLYNPEIEPSVQRLVHDHLSIFFECHPSDTIAIGKRALAAYHARTAAKSSPRRAVD